MKILFSILFGAIFPVLILSGGLVHAQEENATTTSEPEFLSIQHSKSGSISAINATTYTLELNNVSDKTILFSDRPERIVESLSTSDFMGNWTLGQDSFSADAPNAALVIEAIQTGQLDTAVIELFNPSYDTTTNTIRYSIMTENATSIDLPIVFGQSILVIDASQDDHNALMGATDDHNATG